MDEDSFMYLLNKVCPLIIKQKTHLRQPIFPEERLSLTLRHLATSKYCYFIYYDKLFL